MTRVSVYVGVSVSVAQQGGLLQGENFTDKRRRRLLLEAEKGSFM